MKKYIITGVMAAVAATSAFAGTVTASKEVAPVEAPCVFRDNELQLDLFGLGDFYKGANGNFAGNYPAVTGITGESRQLSGRPGWGGGLGLNYIFAKYFGVGIEQSVFGRNSNPTQLGSATYDWGNYGYTRYQTTGNLIFRYPICQWNLAPYLLLGGGAQYGNVPNIDAGAPYGFPNRARYRMAGQGFGHVGGGLEYRVTENIGVFSDLRYLFSGVDGLANNQMQWRYGLRFAF
jgi:hypothetical protein